MIVGGGELQWKMNFALFFKYISFFVVLRVNTCKNDLCQRYFVTDCLKTVKQRHYFQWFLLANGWLRAIQISIKTTEGNKQLIQTNTLEVIWIITWNPHHIMVMITYSGRYTIFVDHCNLHILILRLYLNRGMNLSIVRDAVVRY